MPIWKSSELVAGRTGSPSRRGSARLSLPSQYSTPKLSLSGDGGVTEGSSQQASSPHAAERGSSSRSGVCGVDAAQMAGTAAILTHTALREATSAPGELVVQAPPQQAQQAFMRPPSAQRRGSSGNLFGVSPPTYTVQYVGIANGELGILSQKQRLPPHRPAKAGTGGGGAPAFAHRHTLATGAFASPPAASARPSTAPTGTGRLSTTSTGSGRLPISASQSLQSQSPASSRPSSSSSRSPTRPASAWAAAAPSSPQVPQAAAPQAVSSPGVAAADTGGGAPSQASLEALVPAVAAPSQQAEVKPPSLTSLVEDATGRIKVVSECFYSRALHSRGGPRDRHARRNRPMGPPAQDMELLNTGLPGRFGNRAPSAGGFPGWKLTAVGATPAGGRAGSARGSGGTEHSAEGPGSSAARSFRAGTAAAASAAARSPRGSGDAVVAAGGEAVRAAQTGGTLAYSQNEGGSQG